MEQDRIAAVAREEAEEPRQARIAAGLDPDDSLIEIRAYLDLAQILLSHGYAKRGAKYRRQAISTCSFPSAVTAWSAKMSRNLFSASGSCRFL